MKLRPKIIEALTDDGPANVDQLMPKFPELTRKQIIRSLQEAKLAGLLVITQMGGRRKWPERGKLPATYGVKQETSCPRISSVWQLGSIGA